MDGMRKKKLNVSGEKLHLTGIRYKYDALQTQAQ